MTAPPNASAPGRADFAHTGAVAWAITNAMADYQDLHAERLRRRARTTGRLAQGTPTMGAIVGDQSFQPLAGADDTSPARPRRAGPAGRAV